MNLLVLDQVSLAFGLHQLLERVDFSLEKGERVCLVGRNGAGKSSLLKVIEGRQQADDGEVRLSQGASLAFLEQNLPEKNEESVFQYVASGLKATGDAIARFHALGHKIAESASDEDMAELEAVQQLIDAQNGWQLEQRVNATISQLNLEPDVKMNTLSGGWRRRASLAKALVQQPDILLLDEPTNHLDIENIEWLEAAILAYQGAIIFITHDRRFANQLATRVIELDRGHLSSWKGNYNQYLEQKEQQLEVERRHNAQFDKKLAQEESWIRQGIKARRTRNEGRVRALKQLRKERAGRREVEGTSSFSVEDAERSGKVVAKLRSIHLAFGEHNIIDNFTSTIVRGDRIGLIGPNGCGKSTLIKVILGQLAPSRGHVKEGTNISVAYFDQLKEQLDREKSIIDNVAEGQQELTINGKSRHVISYLKDFLFSPERVNTPVKALSGGEANRLLLAKIFSKPSNLIVLDEPTNDLDMETLDLLEQIISDYQGTVIVVSHDREFLDNVVTSSIVFEGQGQLLELVGGYSDWIAYKQQREQKQAPQKVAHKEKKEEPAVARVKKQKKLSYKDERELSQLPMHIESLENRVTALHATIGDAGFYNQEQSVTGPVLDELREKEQALQRAYERWDELENLKQSFE